MRLITIEISGRCVKEVADRIIQRNRELAKGETMANKHEAKKAKLLKQQRELGKITDKFNKEQQKLDLRRQKHQSKVDKNMSDLKEVDMQLNPSQPADKQPGQSSPQENIQPSAPPDATSEAENR